MYLLLAKSRHALPIFQDKMTIVPTTPAYEVWKKPSIPTTIKWASDICPGFEWAFIITQVLSFLRPKPKTGNSWSARIFLCPKFRWRMAINLILKKSALSHTGVIIIGNKTASLFFFKLTICVYMLCVSWWPYCSKLKSVQKLLANPIVAMLTFREELERVNEEFYDNGTVSYETKKVGFDKIGKN